MAYSAKKSSKKNPKIGRYVVLGLLIFFGWKWYSSPIELYQKVEIPEGGTFYDVLSDLEAKDALKMKLFVKTQKPDFSTLSQGFYQFSGEYSPESFIQILLDGPEKDYLSYTVLEGRSIYDVDHNLAQKDLIEEGEYLTQVLSLELISEMKNNYEFLPEGLDSLEGFLYPDTYFLDQGQPVVSQLIRLQLDTFENKIWDDLAGERGTVFARLQQDYGLSFDRYDLLILASVVEKEERNASNKPIVAGIFFNRLHDGMRLDADITLCYGLKEPYETCTPEVIVQGIYDKKNLFNTRQQAGLPPQAISSVSAETMAAVLSYQKTKNYYYLHDAQGGIHYAETVGGHAQNKNMYLK